MVASSRLNGDKDIICRHWRSSLCHGNGWRGRTIRHGVARAYMLWKDENETLEDHLDKVFAVAKSSTLMADEADIEGFNRFIERLAAFEVEKAAELFRY